MADVIAAYPPWVIRAVVRLAKSRAVERLLLDGPGRVMRPGGHADAFEEWLIEAPLARNRDVDNLKPILDLATNLGLIEDDRMIDDLRIVRTSPPGGDIVVSIWPI